MSQHGRSADAEFAAASSMSGGISAGRGTMDWNAGRESAAAKSGVKLGRCVSAPVTAPRLSGIRVRKAIGGGMDVVFSNPAGGRGLYVLNWTELRPFGISSLHDIAVGERLCAEPILSPATVRAAATGVAADGYAGRRAAQAAQCALAAERLGRLRIRAHLFAEIARAMRVSVGGARPIDPWTSRLEPLEYWLGAAPKLLAERFLSATPGALGSHMPANPPLPWQPCELVEWSDRLAALIWPIGLGPAADRATIPRTLRLLRNTDWRSRGKPGSEMSEHGLMTLHDSVHDRVAQAEAALHRARRLLDNPFALLGAWRADSGAKLQALEEPDWLLDGWDRLCLLPGDAKDISVVAQSLMEDHEQRFSKLGTDAGWTRPASFTDGIGALDQLARNEQMRVRELRLLDPEQADGDG